MPFSLRKLTRLQFVACLFLLLSSFTALAVHRSYRARASTVTTPVVQQKEPKKIVTGVSVNLTRFGFEPSTLSFPKGEYFFSVRNLTERTDIVLVFGKDKDKKAQEEPYKNGSRGWDRILKLTPGDYVVTEKSNPNWELKINVTDKDK